MSKWYPASEPPAEKDTKYENVSIDVIVSDGTYCEVNHYNYAYRGWSDTCSIMPVDIKYWTYLPALPISITISGDVIDNKTVETIIKGLKELL